MTRVLAACEGTSMSKKPERSLWPLAAVFGAVTVALGMLMALRGDVPQVGPILVFGGLFMFAEHQPTELRSGSSMSAGFMLGMASIVVFEHDDSLLGPLLVGICGGFYLPHLHRHEWAKIGFNCGLYGLSVAAAAAVYTTLSPADPSSVLHLLVLAIPSSLAFSVVDLGLLTFGLSYKSRQPIRALLSDVSRSHLQIYPFALLGVFFGQLYLDIGMVAVPLLVVPILTARRTFASSLALKGAQDDTVSTLIKALEAKDPYTSGHAERVATFSQYIGEQLGFSSRRMERLRLAALMHDIGKLIVPNHLLNKAGKLTEQEYIRVRRHEDVSIALLERIDFLAPVATAASSEFAHYTPDDSKFPIEPYIVHVADAFDAMTSTRSYRKALTQEVAFAELRARAGAQFHPDAVEALIAAIESRSEFHGAGHESIVHDFLVTPPESGVGSAGLGDLDAQLAPARQAAP